jgi:hypothetical protein
MVSGFTLATYVQRKMELNNHCSPWPAQCPAPKTTNEFTVTNLNYDGVVVDAQH